jgi:hypothetical protein
LWARKQNYLKKNLFLHGYSTAKNTAWFPQDDGRIHDALQFHVVYNEQILFKWYHVTFLGRTFLITSSVQLKPL